jgi:hypothetical protein
MRPHPFIALAAWIGFWFANGAVASPGSETSLAWGLAIGLLPQLLLGLFAARWWVALAPIALGLWVSIWAKNHPTSGLSEVSGLPFLLGIVAAVVVLVGVLASRAVRRPDHA